MATKTILIVDPYEGIVDVMAQVFEMEGYEVSIVHSPQQAANLLAKHHFDLIISEAFRQSHVFDFDPAFLRDIQTSADGTPIVLCSISPSTHYVRARDHGLADVIPKPFDVGELLNKVDRVLGTVRPTPNGRYPLQKLAS